MNSLTHIVEEYKNWQPTLAAYSKWTDPTFVISTNEAKKVQAIHEFVSEAGEVLGVATKAWRKGRDIPREKIVDELSDALWGLVGVMNEFNISWEEMAQFNMDKLNERYRPSS